jgi:hypothetical protein
LFAGIELAIATNPRSTFAHAAVRASVAVRNVSVIARFARIDVAVPTEPGGFMCAERRASVATRGVSVVALLARLDDAVAACRTCPVTAGAAGGKQRHKEEGLRKSELKTARHRHSM